MIGSYVSFAHFVRQVSAIQIISKIASGNLALISSLRRGPNMPRAVNRPELGQTACDRENPAQYIDNGT